MKDSEYVSQMKIVEISVISSVIQNEIQKEYDSMRNRLVENEYDEEYKCGYLRGLSHASFLVSEVCEQLRKPMLKARSEAISARPNMILMESEFYNRIIKKESDTR